MVIIKAEQFNSDAFMTIQIKEKGSWRFIHNYWCEIHKLLMDFKEGCIEFESLSQKISKIENALLKLQKKSFYPADNVGRTINISEYSEVAKRILNDIVYKQKEITLQKGKFKQIKRLRGLFSLAAVVLAFFSFIFILPKVFIGTIFCLSVSLILSFIYEHKMFRYGYFKELEAEVIQSASYYQKYTQNVLSCIKSQLLFKFEK